MLDGRVTSPATHAIYGPCLTAQEGVPRTPTSSGSLSSIYLSAKLRSCLNRARTRQRLHLDGWEAKKGAKREQSNCRPHDENRSRGPLLKRAGRGMTAEVAILNRSAVALAADSAVTISSQSSAKVYNTVNKLFTLSKFHPVGIMIYGNADYMSVPWETIIKLYRENLDRDHSTRLKSTPQIL